MPICRVCRWFTARSSLGTPNVLPAVAAASVGQPLWPRGCKQIGEANSSAKVLSPERNQVCIIGAPCALCEFGVCMPRETAMWIGRCRSSSIHFDAMDNIHCVLQGEKTFYLWDPWQITQMEMLPLAARADHRPIAAPTVYSILDLPEHQRLAAGMKCVTVSAGDALFIPMVSLAMCTAH